MVVVSCDRELVESKRESFQSLLFLFYFSHNNGRAGMMVVGADGES